MCRLEDILRWVHRTEIEDGDGNYFEKRSACWSWNCALRMCRYATGYSLIELLPRELNGGGLSRPDATTTDCSARVLGHSGVIAELDSLDGAEHVTRAAVNNQAIE
jgi:hypothetical protein